MSIKGVIDAAIADYRARPLKARSRHCNQAKDAFDASGHPWP